MIKVASYNIHKGVGLDRQRSPERIWEVLHEIDADVIALQEADRRFGTRASVLPPHLLQDGEWQAAPVGMRALSTGWHGNAILVRRAATIDGCEPIHLPALEPRGAVAAAVTLPGGLKLRVVGMHLDLSGLWRRRQAAAVMAAVAAAPDRRPAVLMGDLNEWSVAGGCLRDFARHFGFAATGPSFPTRRPLARLDRIMVSPGWRVLDAGVHDTPLARKASDHLPIWATLQAA